MAESIAPEQNIHDKFIYRMAIHENGFSTI